MSILEDKHVDPAEVIVEMAAEAAPKPKAKVPQVTSLSKHVQKLNDNIEQLSVAIKTIRMPPLREKDREPEVPKEDEQAKEAPIEKATSDAPVAPPAESLKQEDQVAPEVTPLNVEIPSLPRRVYGIESVKQMLKNRENPKYIIDDTKPKVSAMHFRSPSSLLSMTKHIPDYESDDDI
jgi:hypothetical protein